MPGKTNGSNNMIQGCGEFGFACNDLVASETGKLQLSINICKKLLNSKPNAKILSHIIHSASLSLPAIAAERTLANNLREHPMFGICCSDDKWSKSYQEWKIVLDIAIKQVSELDC